VLGWTLLALGWIDAEHTYLPDVLTLPLVLAGLAATWFLAPETLADHAAAAAIAYGSLRLLGAAYERLRRREGIGQGDAKLLAAAGAWLGLTALPFVLLVGALLGLALAVPMLLRGRRDVATLQVPFGPPLALAIWLAWLLADPKVRLQGHRAPANIFKRKWSSDAPEPRRPQARHCTGIGCINPPCVHSAFRPRGRCCVPCAPMVRS
jgi:prepilin signal peptidase PulO-like enzyme (type II secretory pathway)